MNGDYETLLSSCLWAANSLLRIVFCLGLLYSNQRFYDLENVLGFFHFSPFHPISSMRLSPHED